MDKLKVVNKISTGVYSIEAERCAPGSTGIKKPPHC